MRRFRFIALRLAQAVPALLALSVVTFVMLRLSPGDPARVIAGPRASAKTLALLHRQMGLDQPLWVQYLHYLTRALGGDFGENLTGSSSVAAIIAQAAPVTASLVISAALLTLIISVPLAYGGARRPDGLVDSGVRVFAVGGLALPSFWVGVMLLTYVALPFGWPVGGWGTDAATQTQALVLPALTLAISMAPILIRGLRSSLIEIMNADYVQAGRSMGVTGGRLFTRFVARNAAAPGVPLIATVLGFLVGGTVVIEAAFNLPGLGLALVQAATTRDANVVQGITLVLGAAVILIHLASDVVLSFVDPRVKL
jgi:peptide/nickel transport system permease protein